MNTEKYKTKGEYGTIKQIMKFQYSKFVIYSKNEN